MTLHRGSEEITYWTPSKTLSGLGYQPLENAVNPTPENRKLYQMDTRTDVLELVYQAMKEETEGMRAVEI